MNYKVIAKVYLVWESQRGYKNLIQVFFDKNVASNFAAEMKKSYPKANYRVEEHATGDHIGWIEE